MLLRTWHLNTLHARVSWCLQICWHVKIDFKGKHSEITLWNYFSLCGLLIFFLKTEISSVTQLCLTLRPHGLQHTRPLSITSSWSPPKPMSIELVMPSNHLILCCPLLLLPSIFPSIRVFSNESVLCIRWPKYWSFQLQHQSFQWIFRTDFL